MLTGMHVFLVWNLQTARGIKSFDAHQAEVVVLKFKDNTLVSGSADATMKVRWCTPTYM
jgi:WD40 repeat protein